jgi:hypothetical protein
MRCQICQDQEATVHLSEPKGRRIEIIDLCEPCCRMFRPWVLAGGLDSSGYRPPPPERPEGLERNEDLS